MDWDLLIPIVIVFFLLRALFKKPDASGTRKPQNQEDAEIYYSIVEEYGNLLEVEAPIHGTVLPEEELPHSKDSIKKAIMFALDNDPDDEYKGALITGYFELAYWQKDVPRDEVVRMGGSNDIGSEFLAALEKTKKEGTWESKIETDKQVLKQELVSGGYLE